MVKQSDLVKQESLEECGIHGNTDDEFEEYSEEESNENLCIPPNEEDSCEKISKVEGSCAEEPNEDSSSDDEDSCAEEPNEEDSDEEPEAASEEYTTVGTVLEEASDEDPTDVSFEEIIEEVSSEESEEEPNGEEPLRGSMDQLPLVNESDGVPNLVEEKKASDHLFSESKASAESSCNQCLRESSNLSTDAIFSKQPDVPLASSKKRRSRWDIKAEAPMLVNDSGLVDKKRKTRWSSDIKAEAPIPVNDNADLDKRRKTRWSSDETQLNMLCMLKLPDSVKDILSDTCNDRRVQKLNAKLQAIHQKLEGSVIVNEQPEEESSPPPPPIDGLDARIDTREFELRLKLLKEKHKIISELLTKRKKKDEPNLPSKHCPIFFKKLYIPFKEYPNYNFVGLILGPKGNSLKKMEKETGATIRLRGIGANAKKKKSPGDYDDMHVLIESHSQTSFDAAVSMLEKLLVPVDDRRNYHKAAQLRELAKMRGTLTQGGLWEMEPCDVCGMSSHPTSDCPLTATTSQANANFLTGSGSLFSSFGSPSPFPCPLKENDPANLFVGFLPLSVSTDKLKELFLPYGSLCEAIVIKDKNTGRSKGYGFIKYTSTSDAAKAIEKMNGYMIEGKKLAVRIAGFSPPLNANLANYPGLASTPPPSSPKENLPNYLGVASIPPPSSSNAKLPSYPGLVSIPPPSTANLPNYLGVASIPPPSSSNANLPSYPGLVSIPPPAANLPNLPNYLGVASIPPPSSSNANLPSYPGLVSIPPPSTANLPNLPNYLGVASIPPPSSSNANLPSYPGLVSIPPPSTANLPNYPEIAAIPREIPEPNCWPGPPGSILPESGISFPNRSYNSLTYTESVTLQSSTSLGSTFQTSLGKNGYMMDGKKLEITVGNPPPSLNANLPNYPGFAAIPREIPEPNCWPGPPGSLLPESGTYFPKSSYNSLKNTESVPWRSSTLFGSTCQTSISSSQIPGVTAASNELASFPGYLKSIDPSDQFDQSMPSSSLPSQVPYFIRNFSGNPMNPTWR